MKAVLRDFKTGKLFVRKVNNALDVIGEDVVGLYPDEDLLLMTNDVDMVNAIYRRLGKIGAPDHPVTPPRIRDEFLMIPGERKPAMPADKDGFRVLSMPWLKRLLGKE